MNHGNVERLYPIPKGEEKGYGKTLFDYVCVLNNWNLLINYPMNNKQVYSDASHQTVRIHGAHHEPL